MRKKVRRKASYFSLAFSLVGLCKRAALAFAAASAVGRRTYFNARHQQEIDVVGNTVGLENGNCPPLRCRRHVFAAVDRNLSPVGKVENERLKGLRVVEFADLLDGHRSGGLGT